MACRRHRPIRVGGDIAAGQHVVLSPGILRDWPSKSVTRILAAAPSSLFCRPRHAQRLIPPSTLRPRPVR
eukprot:464062-Pleurochrysis_carterae.AAC.5